MFKKKYLLVLLIAIFLFLYLRPDVKTATVEDLSLHAGGGLDIETSTSGELMYVLSLPIYNFHTEPTITSINFPVSSTSIGEIRQTRQLKLDRRFTLGLERLFLTSEDAARFGIEPWINLLFSSPFVNNMAYYAVCSGKARDILSVKIPGYPNSSDFINGMIKSSVEHNFFGDDYKLLDVYMHLGNEGKNLAVPYIEYENNNLKTTGMAVFKKDKMVRKIDIGEVKFMNLLREDDVKGLLSIQKSPHEYINYYAKSKRKVKCKKTGDNKYLFTIELSLTGDIISNLLYDNLYQNPEVIKNFEKDMSDTAEKMCNDFIVKMQNEYRLDLLELGSIAAATYGRKSGADWDEVVSNSKIKVKVNAKVDILSRGDYRINGEK